MRAAGEGRIIQNSSVLGLVAMPYRGAYNCSKFALEGLTDTLRLELHGSGIHVSLIEPGPIVSRFRDNALAQLRASAGKTVVFHTGLCLLNTASGTAQTAVEHFAVDFRDLDDSQITRYVDREQPYNCAGSFKSEGLGISLFEAMEGEDPSALIGLPLIWLAGVGAGVLVVCLSGFFAARGAINARPADILRGAT